MSTSLFMCAFEPFRPWKHTERSLREGRARGMEVVIAWDHRNSADDKERMRTLADKVLTFHSEGHCEDGFKFVQACSGDFVLMIADDEIPSAPLWEFALRPSSPSRFLVSVVPIIGNLIQTGHVGLQERLVWREGWEWVPRVLADGTTTTFEASSIGAPQVMLMGKTASGQPYNAGHIVWHYLLSAPLEEREAKARRYAEIDPEGEHRSRLFYEDQLQSLVPIPEDLRPYLPEVNSVERQDFIQSRSRPAAAAR